MKFLACAAALSAAGWVAHAAHAQHEGDVGLVIQDGSIITTEITASGIGVPRLVFSAQFGNTGSPGFTSDPGFDCVPGTFAVGTRVGFSFAEELLRWDGASYVPTNAVNPLLGERLRAAFLTANATTGAGPAPGFDLAVQSNGGWHRHLSYTLLPASGQSAPANGVYLLQLTLYSTDPAVGPSQPFALVMSNNAGSEEFADAYAAAEALFYPPACPADLDGSGTVDGTDLGLLLGAWGQSGVADLDGSGTVDGTDLGMLLGSWGVCSS